MDKKTINEYEHDLKNMIMKRTGEPCEEWLLAQVRATASNMAVMYEIENSIINSECTKTATALIPYYTKLQNELRMQYQSLGLNYQLTA